MEAKNRLSLGSEVSLNDHFSVFLSYSSFGNAKNWQREDEFCYISVSCRDRLMMNEIADRKRENKNSLDVKWIADIDVSLSDFRTWHASCFRLDGTSILVESDTAV
jgi:hypothetical protein